MIFNTSNFNTTMLTAGVFGAVTWGSSVCLRKMTQLSQGTLWGLSVLVGGIASGIFLFLSYRVKKNDQELAEDLSNYKTSPIVLSKDKSPATKIDKVVQPKLKKQNSTVKIDKEEQSTLEQHDLEISEVDDKEEQSILEQHDLEINEVDDEEQLIVKPLSDHLSTKEIAIRKIQLQNVTYPYPWFLVGSLKEEIKQCKDSEGIEIILPDFSCCGKVFTMDIFEEIAKVCPNLRYLSLSAINNVGFPFSISAGFDSLSKLTCLESLKISGIQAKELPLIQNKKLKTLHIEDCYFDEFPRDIKNLSNLSSLEMYGNLFNKTRENETFEEDYSEILLGLTKSLTHLKLQDYHLQCIPSAFLNSISQFTSLSQLDLKGNSFPIEDFDTIKQNPSISLLYDNLLDEPLIDEEKENLNVLIIGKTRTGKSTITDLFVNELESKKHLTIFSETKNSNLSSIDFPDYCVNIHDSPGMFEILKSGHGHKTRTNKEIMRIIAEHNEQFFGGKGFQRVDRVIFTININSGLKEEDIQSLELSILNLQCKGLAKNVPLAIAITFCEKTDRKEQKNLKEQLMSNTRIKTLIDKYKIMILFSGVVSAEIVEQKDEYKSEYTWTKKQVEKSLRPQIVGWVLNKPMKQLPEPVSSKPNRLFDGGIISDF